MELKNPLKYKIYKITASVVFTIFIHGNEKKNRTNIRYTYPCVVELDYFVDLWNDHFHRLVKHTDNV